MADFRLSARADADLAGIANYTIETFGIEPARQYRDALEACFHNLVWNPHLGRSVKRLAPSLRRFQLQSYAVCATRTMRVFCSSAYVSYDTSPYRHKATC